VIRRDPMHRLRIARATLESIFEMAREAGADECMGLLAARPGEATIDAAPPLDAEASPARAEAEPLSIRDCVEGLARKGFVPKGIWHSHGDSEPFHSNVDVETIHRLLPAMAPSNLRPLTDDDASPRVRAMDEASLPTPGGPAWRFVMNGPPVEGLAAWTRVGWSSIQTSFIPTDVEPSAQLIGNQLRLMGGGVRLDLGIPEGASLRWRRAESQAARWAHLYSLVVNSRADRFCECFVAIDVAGRITGRLEPCRLEVSPPARESAETVDETDETERGADAGNGADGRLASVGAETERGRDPRGI